MMTVHLQYDLERLFSSTFESFFGAGWSVNTFLLAECSTTANGNRAAGNSRKKPEDLVKGSTLFNGLYGPCTPGKT